MENYFVVLKVNGGRYECRNFSSEEEFRKKERLEGLVIEKGISEKDAKAICLDYNDSHFIPDSEIIRKILAKFQ